MSSPGISLRGILFPPQESPFRRTWPGWVIVVLNVLLGIMSANFFMGMMKFNVSEWLLLNTCVPS